MDIIVFAIAFGIMMIGMIVLMLLNTYSLPVVKAGKVTKFCNKKKCVFGAMPNRVRINNQDIDLSDNEKMVVSGNSMKEYRIFDGQRIYVKRYSEDEKNTIQRYPVLVFNIVNTPNEKDATYKLRKFVGYITTCNWTDVFVTFQDRIKIDKDTFTSLCEQKYAKTPQADRDRLVLSETYDEEHNTVLYSLHPVSTIYGKVEYAV